jgi:transcriptional regulator with XRE-family HTH domain
MARRERPTDRGRRRLREAVARLRRDHREARVAAGLSLRAVARAVGASHSEVRRFEIGETADPSLDFVAACCAAVGLELGVRAYPAGDPIRDRAHLELLERLRRRLHPSLGWRTEVPLPIPGDLRAWDAEVRGGTWRAWVDAETVVPDGQALERRLALKARDAARGHLILLIADTRVNRAAMTILRPGWRELLPLDTRELLSALSAGRDPGSGGIVIL